MRSILVFIFITLNFLASPSLIAGTCNPGSGRVIVPVNVSDLAINGNMIILPKPIETCIFQPEQHERMSVNSATINEKLTHLGISGVVLYDVSNAKIPFPAKGACLWVTNIYGTCRYDYPSLTPIGPAFTAALIIPSKITEITGMSSGEIIAVWDQEYCNDLDGCVAGGSPSVSSGIAWILAENLAVNPCVVNNAPIEVEFGTIDKNTLTSTDENTGNLISKDISVTCKSNVNVKLSMSYTALPGSGYSAIRTTIDKVGVSVKKSGKYLNSTATDLGLFTGQNTITLDFNPVIASGTNPIDVSSGQFSASATLVLTYN